ncbi:protein tramtrack, beta isoform-like isoform X4 [Cylas formicarius]|uniref:protein tramtrack, beta isoform-like isoform X4 n=1 Tax=Cylas formicarius TaxID=197179 RepID=UPI002958A12C|nr:protein tramtrack, beta isoform-like isoform X4 [Cylas formicarius]
MTMQQYCLRWNNHQPNFISVFSSLLNSESLVDVTLAAEGKHLQAHKVVLSACSSYFQSLFTVNPCQHPIVILKDVKFVDLKTMVDFMYYGEVNVSQEQLPYILKTAEMLKIKGLAEIPVDQTLQKTHGAPVEKAELLTPGDSNWSSDGMLAQSSTPSPCPLSPASRRKRLRKSSTGSGSGSTERPIEEQPADVMNVNVLSSVIKSDPGSYSSDNCGALGLKTKQHSSDSEQLQRGSSHESVEGETLHQISLVPQQHQQQPDMTTMPHGMNASSSVDISGGGAPQTSVAGIQWNIVEQQQQPQQGYAGHFNACPPPESAAPAAPPDPPFNPDPAQGYVGQGGGGGGGPAPMTQQKRKRSVNPQADENFIRALEAVRFGGIGFCKAARMYGVNNRTLWLEYKKRGYPNFRLSIKNRKQEVAAASGATPGPAQAEPAAYETKSHTGGFGDGKTAAGSGGGGEQILCTSHPVALISSNYFEGKHVDVGPMMQRPKWDPGLVNPSAAGINFHNITFEHM